MRIVSRAEFLAMPEDTVFSKYEPCCFGELQIKGETLSHCSDFLCQRIADAISAYDSEAFSDLLNHAQETGRELSMDFDSQMRDGCFDDDQLFAVWSHDDIRYLINRLSRCIARVLE